MLRNLFTGNFDLMALVYTLAAVVIALSVHEWAHAYSAYRLGDPTARNLGRMTIDPLQHLDLFGFLSMMFLGFGWAKPVPVNPNNLRYGRWGEIIVSAAGVFTNLLLAFLFTIVLVAVELYAPIAWWSTMISDFSIALISINLGLLVFNLLPIPPLDGYRVVKGLLIGKVRDLNLFWTIERYSGMILMVLLLLLPRLGITFISDFIGWCINGIFGAFLRVAMTIFGVPV
ncbi:MAG: site-2 protease family protein [Christensenellales bacterium]|jgi:Zn-dependent protease